MALMEQVSTANAAITSLESAAGRTNVELNSETCISLLLGGFQVHNNVFAIAARRTWAEEQPQRAQCVGGERSKNSPTLRAPKPGRRGGEEGVEVEVYRAGVRIDLIQTRRDSCVRGPRLEHAPPEEPLWLRTRALTRCCCEVLLSCGGHLGSGSAAVAQ
uniref:Uncharacterized protein n=1 Tax=Knipowitschia caucasica TaxID=637954 RepID=A0AAV2L6Y7_KNICA